MTTLKKTLQKLLDDLKAGEYDAWAESYINDWLDVNDLVIPSEIIAIVKDFIACRIIEIEEGLK